MHIAKTFHLAMTDGCSIDRSRVTQEIAKHMKQVIGMKVHGLAISVTLPQWYVYDIADPGQMNGRPARKQQTSTPANSIFAHKNPPKVTRRPP